MLAAWFLWIAPLVAALSSLRLVATSSSPALSLSPSAAAVRNARMAVCSDDYTNLLRTRRCSLVRMRFFCDLMLATLENPSQLFVGKSRCDRGDCPLGVLREYQHRRAEPKARALTLQKPAQSGSIGSR